jgi:hypothetical protein
VQAGAAGTRSTETVHVVLWADRDDDDVDGRPDCEQPVLAAANLVDVVEIDRRLIGRIVEAPSGGEHVRMGGPAGVVAWGRAAPKGAWLQGVSPGHAEIAARTPSGTLQLSIDVLGIDVYDGARRRVDLARSHASLARTAPSRVDDAVDGPFDDPDALELIVSSPEGGPSFGGGRSLGVESLSGLGVRVDALPQIHLAPVPCAGGATGLRCWASLPLRFVVDDVDRDHPLGFGRSVRAELGGAVVVRSEGRKAQMLRVLGPRSTIVGPIGRYRATVRPFVVRVAPGGVPAVGGSDAGAVVAVRTELAAAAAVWGQCGLSFGEPRSIDVHIVDPPPPHLLSFGDGLGMAAGGGRVRLRADGRPIDVPMVAGASPELCARDIARSVERAGLVAIVSPNARSGPALWPSVDVSVRRHDGTLATLDTMPGVPLSTDPQLAVRIGSVDLSDGIAHFTDMDAMAGTLEERTLIKSIDDGDPTTIEVIVVPLFAGGGRIGESFIASDLSSVRNVVLLDRAGVRARQSSLTLAHELGHVLLDLPGHPDDFGIDTPTSLMDSDAADPSPFGPRRLSADDCARMVRQSGPGARVPMLVEWPIGPLPGR